ncbi:glycoside hydrolase family 9 protein [Kribbella sindirgiensis]|uniref:Uncharacterized protein n=1 Tax=Kribbella sindirgiensis TaxID=1124744 RepID=A0A4R0HWM5_9ACTN|nr:glycoside hydrolase family 9 protein [Kribbella sindirgiensis]TCC14580.1 hypothetical protein E0H50_42630 [Kribbella sindirgiensis]
MTAPGWFRADAAGRPFVHAVEPGLPILALLRFAQVFPTTRQADHARATTKPATGGKARTPPSPPSPAPQPAPASASTTWVRRTARLTTFAEDQMAWILGRNPYDVCMLQGRGRNNPEYYSDFPNLPGGIVNGITSG